MLENQEFSLGYAYGVSCDMSTKEGKQTWAKLCAIIFAFVAISYAFTIPVITYPYILERVGCFDGLFLNRKEQGYCAPSVQTDVIGVRNKGDGIFFYRTKKADLKNTTRDSSLDYSSHVAIDHYSYYGVTLGPDSSVHANVKSARSDTVFEFVTHEAFNNFTDGKDYDVIDKQTGTVYDFTYNSTVLSQYFVLVTVPSKGSYSGVTYKLTLKYTVYDVSNLTSACDDAYCTFSDVQPDEIIIADNPSSSDYDVEVNYPSEFNGVNGGIVGGILALLILPVIVLLIYLAAQRALFCLVPKNDHGAERQGLLQNSAIRT